MQITEQINQPWDKLIQKAKRGNQTAITELYNRTYSQGFSVALQMVNNEEDAMDILQNAYISAFYHLHTIKEPEKFKNWFNCIVANKCRDFLRKHKDIVFSEMGGGEDTSYEDTLESDLIEFSPEQSVDYSETKKLVNDILQALPQEQRLCVLMYYYNELSVREIAEVLECSENTVKSRLNYARKKIKEEVLALEKKGTKLYNVAPLPFIVWTLHSSESMQCGVLSKKLMAEISKGIKKKFIKNLVGKFAMKKVMIGAVAVVVVTAGCVTVVELTNSIEDEKEETIQEYLLNHNYKYVGDEILYGEYIGANGDVAGKIVYEKEPSNGYWSYKEHDFDGDGQDECAILTINNDAGNIISLHMLERRDGKWNEADVYEVHNKNWLYYSLKEIENGCPSGADARQCRLDIFHELDFYTIEKEGKQCILMADATMLPESVEEGENGSNPYFTQYGQVITYEEEKLNILEEYAFTNQQDVECWNEIIYHSQLMTLGSFVVESVGQRFSFPMTGEDFCFRYTRSRSAELGFRTEQTIDYYHIYGAILKEYQFSDEMFGWYPYYYLCDIDKNGIYEMFVCDSTNQYSDYNAHYVIYTIDSEKNAVFLGSVSAYRAFLYMDEYGGREKFIYLLEACPGDVENFLRVRKIEFQNNKLKWQDVEFDKTIFENGGYSYYIVGKETNDLSLLYDKNIYRFKEQIGISTIR